MPTMSFADLVQTRVVRLLRWSEKYTKTDMVYLTSGGFWLTLGQIGSILFSLALAIIFGHFATQDTYGNYKYIINIGSLLSALSLSGIGPAVTRAAARGQEGALSQGRALNIKWSWPMVCAGLLASFYYYHVGNTFASTGLLLVSFTLPFINGFTLYDPFLVGLREFRLDVIFSIISLAFTTSALAVTLLFFSQRAVILIAVYFLTNLSTDALWYVISQRKAHNDAEDPQMLNYGFHLSLMSMIGAIADKIDSIAIFTFLGPVQLAVYTYAIAMPEQIKAIVKNVSALSLPKFAQRSISEIKHTITWRLVQLSLALSIAVILYILVCPILFRYLFPVYVQSIGYSQLYAVSVVFAGVISTLVAVMESHRSIKQLYVATNVAPIVIIILLPILTYYWGILGAVLAQLVYRLVNAVVTYWQFSTISE